MDPLAVLAYGAEQALPLIGMEWNGMDPLPPECHDDQQWLGDVELSRPPWKD